MFDGAQCPEKAHSKNIIFDFVLLVNSRERDPRRPEVSPLDLVLLYGRDERTVSFGGLPLLLRRTTPFGKKTDEKRIPASRRKMAESKKSSHPSASHH